MTWEWGERDWDYNKSSRTHTHLDESPVFFFQSASICGLQRLHLRGCGGSAKQAVSDGVGVSTDNPHTESPPIVEPVTPASRD